MQVYEDVHKLRDYVYDDLLLKLTDKVHEQRVQIRKKSEEMEIHRAYREQKEVGSSSTLLYSGQQEATPPF